VRFPLVYGVVDIHTISPFIPSVAFGRAPFNPTDSILTDFTLSILSMVLSPRPATHLSTDSGCAADLKGVSGFVMEDLKPNSVRAASVAEFRAIYDPKERPGLDDSLVPGSTHDGLMHRSLY
jgi:hypothetical protein